MTEKNKEAFLDILGRDKKKRSIELLVDQLFSPFGFYIREIKIDDMMDYDVEIIAEKNDVVLNISIYEHFDCENSASILDNVTVNMMKIENKGNGEKFIVNKTYSVDRFRTVMLGSIRSYEEAKQALLNKEFPDKGMRVAEYLHNLFPDLSGTLKWDRTKLGFFIESEEVLISHTLLDTFKILTKNEKRLTFYVHYKEKQWADIVEDCKNIKAVIDWYNRKSDIRGFNLFSLLQTVKKHAIYPTIETENLVGFVGGKYYSFSISADINERIKMKWIIYRADDEERNIHWNAYYLMDSFHWWSSTKSFQMNYQQLSEQVRINHLITLPL